ncbi:MAG: hypothetical protein M3309_07715 [Actinomycetota bacterium]|nr:hypothetical protein [Actinomycetota bacterium]
MAQVPRVLTFTAHAPVEDIAGVTLAGADGYLHKGISGEELLDAVERTRAGGRVWLLPAGNEKESRLAWRRPLTRPGSPPKTRRSSPSSSGGAYQAEIAEVLCVSLYAGRKEPRIQYTAQAQPREPTRDLLSSLSPCFVRR